MKYSSDLHIHSALSPCGDDEMTPNNIVNMAHIKGLNVISVTDHNSMENVKVITKLGKERDILVVPGMEVTTKEEVHVLCYFRTIEEGLKFQEIIYKGLPQIKNKEDIFGRQLIIDKDDNIVDKISILLINATIYSLKEINKLVKRYKGVMVPAHIDKKSYGILTTLGFIPKDLNITSLEVTKKCDLNKLKHFVDLERYNIIVDSDAHYLSDISEPDFFINLRDKNIDAVIEFLSNIGGEAR